MSTTEALPRWDLSSLYPSLESPEYEAAQQQLAALLDDLEQYCAQQRLNATAPTGETDAELSAAISGYLERRAVATLLYGRVSAYAELIVYADSYNVLARRKASETEQADLRLKKVAVPFQGWLGRRIERLPRVLALGGVTGQHAFFLEETARLSRYLMSEAEEALATELSVSGASAWGKLHDTVVSQISVPYELDGKVEKLPMPALVNLKSHSDREVRRRAYEAELEAWRSVREPLAAALNGVKGAAHTLNQRRGREDDLHTALDQARINRATLETMQGAIADFLPTFRRYLRAKARKLGLAPGTALAWYDLGAPLGASQRKLSYGEAKEFILANFARFSPDLTGLARRAFEQQWIDAEPRDGKSGITFCQSISAIEESRIMCNYDGSLQEVFGLAHELGHAYHNYCLAGRTPFQRRLPMTLAETASIFCETLATNAALEQTASPQEELAILEAFLSNACTIIVDVSGWFRFEKEVFERRAQAELSADELCDIMRRAQLATFGAGLDERYLHPYTWAWWPHYYFAHLDFYNFPYAFGLLFGLGLYAIYEQRGADFLPQYRELLSNCGMHPAAGLAAGFGIDLRSPEFWKASLALIEQRIARFEALEL